MQTTCLPNIKFLNCIKKKFYELSTTKKFTIFRVFTIMLTKLEIQTIRCKIV